MYGLQYTSFPVVSLQAVPLEATLQDGDEPKEDRNTPEASLVQINSCVQLVVARYHKSSMALYANKWDTGMAITVPI